MKYFRCGKILKTHGIKGDLKVALYTDFDRFEIGNRLYIKHNDEYIEVKVCKSSDFGKIKNSTIATAKRVISSTGQNGSFFFPLFLFFLSLSSLFSGPANLKNL